MNLNSNHIELRRLGGSDLFVSPVALGTWPIAGMTSLDVNDADSLLTIHSALESGINFIDTAHCYGATGESELLIGQAINDPARKYRRQEIVIATKGGIHWDAKGIRHYDGRPDRIVRECEESLRRMRIESVDLMYLHAADPHLPVEESATAFSQLIDAGKIRTAGASNLSVEQMEKFQSVCPLTAAQPAYNMLQREIEADLIPWCRERNIAVINYWPLMKGLLAGKIRRGHKFDPADKRLSYDVFKMKSLNARKGFLTVWTKSPRQKASHFRKS